MFWHRFKRLLLNLPLACHRRGWTRLAGWLIGLGRKWRPGHPLLALHHALILRAGGHTHQALTLLKTIDGSHPGHPRIGHELGIVQYEAGHHADALHIFQRLSNDFPDWESAHFYRGLALARLQRYESAVGAFRRAIQLNPNHYEAHHDLGSVLQTMGQLEPARIAYEKALALRPDRVDSHLQYGHLLTDLGRFEAAERCLHRVLEMEPDTDEALHGLSVLGRVSKRSDHIQRMQSRLSGEPGDRRQTVRHHFTLARAFLEQGDEGRAMDHFMAANQLKRSGFYYDIDQDAAWMDRIATVFDTDFFSSRRQWGSDSRLPIFILGMPRSGTTLVEQILASHPRVHGAGELNEIGRLSDEMGALSPSSRGFPEAAGDFDAQTWQQWGEAYVAALRLRDPDAERVTDKMPHNFLLIGLIHTMLPNARIIHCRRDPVDTGLSCFMQNFASGHLFSHDLTEVGRYYRHYDRLMNHWNRQLPGRLLEVHYEKLVTDPETEIRRLLTACDLSWHAGCLEFHTLRRPVRTSSVTQVRRPLYQTAVGRWRRLRSRLGPLLEALGPLVPD